MKRKNKNGEVDEDKMPGLDKLLRGILQYRTAVKPDMLKQFQNVRNNPQVKFYKFMVYFERFIAKVSVKVTSIYGVVVGLLMFTSTFTVPFTDLNPSAAEKRVFDWDRIRQCLRFINSTHLSTYVIQCCSARNLGVVFDANLSFSEHNTLQVCPLLHP